VSTAKSSKLLHREIEMEIR